MGLHRSVYGRSSPMHTNTRAQPEKVFFMRWLEVRLGRDSRRSCGIAFCMATSIPWRVNSEQVRRWEGKNRDGREEPEKENST